MDKLLYTLSFLAAAALIAGSAFIPESAPMWLASTTDAMNIVRGVLAAMMLGLFVTNPPRSMPFRLGLGVAGLGLAALSMGLLLSGSIHIVDVLLFAEAAVCFMLAAIEAKPVVVEHPVLQRLQVNPATLGGNWLNDVRSTRTTWMVNTAVVSSVMLHHARRHSSLWPKFPSSFNGRPP